MHFSKVACLAIALLCLVGTGVCTELDDGLTRVRNEIDPITFNIDNDCAVGNNILGGISGPLSDPNAVTCSAQAAFYEVILPHLDAVNLLNTVLSGTAAASCLTGAAEKIVEAAATAAIGYVNCVAPVVALVPGQLSQIQGIVTRRNAPTVVNIYADLVGIVQQFSGTLLGLVDAINTAINSVISEITAIAADLVTIFSQVAQTALSIATCAVNVKLAEIQAAVNIVTGIVTCATNLNVPVTPPVLPPTPEDISVIINQALTSFDSFAGSISAVANAIANAAYLVKVLAEQIAAVTVNIVTNAIAAAVQLFIDKLTALKSIYFLNPGVITELQSGIDKIVTIKNTATANALQVIAQLAQQAGSLKQQCVDLDDELKRHVRNKGKAAITACYNNVMHGNPNYVKVCSNTVLKNVPLVTDKIKGDVDVVNAGHGQLKKVFDGALPGQSAIAKNQASKEFDVVKNNIANKFNINI